MTSVRGMKPIEVSETCSSTGLMYQGNMTMPATAHMWGSHVLPKGDCSTSIMHKLVGASGSVGRYTWQGQP
jgi:hypothetical protein